jgi:magnesium-transporting ATPase (P-type)
LSISLVTMGGEEEAAGPVRNMFPWHAKTKEECFAELGCKPDLHKTGLTVEEAKTRLEKYGYNKLTEKEKVTLLQRIWAQVANVLVGILVFVAIVSVVQAATADTTDKVVTNSIQVGLIVFVITINTCIGIIQEGSAEAAAEALKNMLSSDAIAVRNGKEVKVPSAELVPGDVVKLSLGDRVPADLRMCDVGNLAAQEAALTGESVPIDKTVDSIPVEGDPSSTPLGDRHNMCFSATLISQGTGTGVIVSTGDYTEIGTINALVNKVEKKKTNVLEQIDTVSKWLAVFITITSLATWFVAFFITDLNGIDALSTALVSAVAMIPEGLEAIVTMTYAWAVSNMAKQNAIIRALPAVETLGSVTVICSDKTGTLTQNVMSLTAFVTSNKRFKFDVNAAERTPTNFVVDNSYLQERADHSKFLSRTEIIKKGPSAERSTNRGRKSTFPFGISLGFGKTNRGEPEASKPEETAEVPTAADDKGDTPTIAGTEAGAGESPDSDFLRKALGGGILCSKCSLGENGGRAGEIGNPTELSILRAAYFGNVPVSEVKDSSPVVAEVPFSSEYKFMATVHEPIEENDGSELMNKLIVHVKGAPDRMIPLCKYQAKGGSFKEEDLEPCERDYWIDQIAILSSHGLRVLALTRGSLEKGAVKQGEQLGPEFVQERGEPWLTIVGLCAIMDPPRPECVQAIAEAHGAGVRVAMITGDHRDTALAIGSMLGLVDREHSEAVTGPEMDSMSEAELRIATQKYNVFARASPQNKIRIVKALQAEGEVCGMTGDGVNDAPALKAADMGVAMGKEGTDVAREAAEMILADDNFATIISAVREGRVVWDNLRKVLLINTPINNAQGMSVLFGLLFGLKETPLSSIQVLYCNLICAVTLGFVAAVEPAEDGIMELEPRRVGKRLIGRFLALRIAIGTITLVGCTVGSVFWAKDLGYTLEETRSQALNTLSFGAISVTMSARFSRKSAFHARTFQGNPIAWWSYMVMGLLQVFITYTPGLNDTIFSMAGMDGPQWGIVALFMVVMLVVMEAEKAVRNYLTALKYDTDDREYGIFDSEADRKPDTTPLPDEFKRFGTNELSK